MGRGGLLRLHPPFDFVPRYRRARDAAIIKGDTAVSVDEEQAIRKRLVTHFHLPIRAVEQAGDRQAMMLHFLLDLLLSFGGVAIFAEVAPLHRNVLVGIADIHEQKFDVVPVALMQAVQVNHLRAEKVSAKAAEDEADRLSTEDIAEANRLAVAQTR